MKIAVVSSVYGDYDKIRIPPEQSVKCEWILVTGEPADDCAPWCNVVEPRPRVHPRLASRVAKCHPEYYTDADIIIWLDGNLEITSPDFIRWCIDSLGDGYLCLTSLRRENVYHEIETSEKLGKWDGDMLSEQAADYIAKGYPPDYGIWWCGLMVRTRDCPDFGDRWLNEMVRWSCQDQIAFSYIMFSLGIRPTELGLRFDQIIPEIQSAAGGIRLVNLGFKHDNFNLLVHPRDK